MGQSKRAVSLSSRRPAEWQIDWNHVIKEAAKIVKGYDTGVTLRQLYYRLVARGLIPNKANAYKHLSRKTAQARREKWFPTLIDRTRAVEAYANWDNGKHAVNQMLNTFRLDRTVGQPYQIYLGVEKHGLSVQLMHWFGDLGIPILALGGYSSQTFVDEVVEIVNQDGRQSVLLYAGDFDPSGMDIDRDFKERTDIFDKVIRIGLNRKLVDKYNLPPAPGKETDSRSAQFILEHGELVQVELDALEPEDLHKLYKRHIDKYWDTDAYDAILLEEAAQRAQLKLLSSLMGGEGHVNPLGAGITLLREIDTSEDVKLLMDAAYARLVELDG